MVEYRTRSFWYGVRVGELYLHTLCRTSHRPAPVSTIAVHTASSDTKAHARAINSDPVVTSLITPLQARSSILLSDFACQATACRRHTASIQRRCNLSERPAACLQRLADDGEHIRCEAESTEAKGEDRDGRKGHENYMSTVCAGTDVSLGVS
jgi:hypothetical protein